MLVKGTRNQLLSALKSNLVFFTDTGTANAIVISPTPAVTALVNGQAFDIACAAANTGAVTLKVNALNAFPVLGMSGPLQGGEITANGVIRVIWSAFNNAFLITGQNTKGPLQISPATQSNHAVSMGQLPSLTNGVTGDARNLKMSVASASATATLTADEVIVGSAIGGSQYRIGNFNKTINLATTGAGGMDTGAAPASGWIAVYAIYNPTTGASALLAVNTTSAVAPSVYGGSNMPTGYTASALLSVWRTTSGSILQAGYQRGRKIITPRVDVLTTSSNPGSFTAIGLVGAIPLNAVSCTGYAFCNSGSGTGAATLVLSSDSSGIGFIQAYAGTTGAIGSDICFDMMIAVTQNLFYQLSWTTSGASNATVGINGYSI